MFNTEQICFVVFYSFVLVSISINMATIHIQSGKNELKCVRKKIKTQSIPFKLHADCDAQVNNYFNNYVKCGEDSILKTSFRGYPLRGKNIDVPDEYTGLILHESIRPSREKDERKFYVVGEFSEITYWNWDKSPTLNDPFSQALQWIDIAEALHSPILEE